LRFREITQIHAMKIIHLADSMEMGGAEKLISLLCRQQRQQGHDPSVHCLYRVGVLGEKLLADGFEVTLHHPTTIMRRALGVYSEFKRARPEVVHCHNATAAIIGALPARLAGAKSIVVTRHGLVPPPYALRRELKFAVASRWCDCIVAVCEQARRNLMAAPFAARGKIVHIYNAVPTFHRNGTPPPVKSGFTLLHVARLSPAKDQATLVRAFALAKDRVPDLRLWIVGDGPLRSKLESMAQEIGLRGSVTFFGEQADVAPFFAAADLFVLSSVTEGVPVSLLEAMSAGLPAIVTDVGGMAEVARLSGATVIAPPSNPAALADAIRKVAQSRSELPRLRELVLQCYLANFTLERMANEYMRLYKSSSSRQRRVRSHC
jgi:glycosyltransferase involved in cell wall biosynthesis